MVTLGYIEPTTGTKLVVEVGVRDEERGGYWAMLHNPMTHESFGGVFFAPDADLF